MEKGLELVTFTTFFHIISRYMSVVTSWGELGYITYKRTYSRRLSDSDPTITEEFEDTIDRVIGACDKQLKVGFCAAEELELAELLLKLKGSVAGRFLWQLGTKTVDKLGLLSLQNCAFTKVDAPIRPFTWAFDALMLGSGVGFNIQRENVYQISKLKRKIKIIRKDTGDADFIVPDSREGWVELLRRVLEAHFITGEGFTYSTICIRGAGTLIKGFGGVASGPESLCWGMSEISNILNNRASKKLRPIDALDIMNIIGAVVVSGNVRRSAQIAIGDYDDIDYLNAKRWDLGNIPNWRANSNNSVVCNDISKLPAQFWQGYLGNGEPYGLINLKLARSCGRLGEIQYPDPEIDGFNPCAEQSLADKETCCLAEIFLPNIVSKKELFKVATYLYRICKHSLTLPCHLKETEAIVHKNMRMGIGITGYLQSTDEQKSWLDECYKFLREYDNEYSDTHGFSRSIKLTTVKPSGTLSLLPGIYTPGGHPGYARYFIRRMRIASDSSLVEDCKQHGYHVEYVKNFDGTEDKRTVVVEFPCRLPDHATLSKDITAIQQLEVCKELQSKWSDNSVSVTIYYRSHELDGIKEWLLHNYNDGLKTVSFLLHNDHGFVQAPLEEIDEDTYKSLVAKTRIISSTSFKEEDVELSSECENGACPIR